jgi:PAS domain S-box-containing protein
MRDSEIKTLRAAEEWRQIFDSMIDAVLVINRGLTITRLNKAAARLFRGNPKDLVGKSCFHLIYGRENPCDTCPHKGVLENGNHETFDEHIPHLGKTMLIDVSPITEGNVTSSNYIHVLRDITEIKSIKLEQEKSQLQLIQSFKGIAQAMGKMVEQRDPYTAGHADGVSRLAVAIGYQMGLDEDTIEGLRVCGLLHDVGKISVPAEILTKPTKLTEMEFRMVKLHSSTGYEILKNVDFPWPVATVTLQHHERLNGSGYPEGLKGEQIIRESRILAVADVVDAMTTHRPYRPALGLGMALDEIRKGRGIIYDIETVDACLEVIEKREKRIMIVDDEISILSLLSDFFTRIGHEVLTFDSPKAALESFVENPFPIVITDLNMPEMHGLELIKQMKKATNDIKIIVLTGYGQKDEVVEALRLGVTDFIDKPVKLKTIQDAVEKSSFQRLKEEKVAVLSE